MTGKQLTQYLAIAFIWGFTWIFILKVVLAFGGGGIALRAILGSLALYLAAKVMRRKLTFGALVPLLIVGATTVAGQLLGFNFATPLVGTAITAILAATIPLFSMLIGHLWHIEKISKIGSFGLLMGFGGVVLIVGFPSVEIDFNFIFGCTICILGAIAAAYGTNYTKLHLQKIGYWEQSIGSFFLGGVMMLPMFLIDPPKAMPEPIDYFYLAVLAIVSTGLGYVMYFKLVSEIGATSVLTVEFLVTVIAVTVGAVLLGETLTFIQIIGGGAIMLGCALVLDLIPAKSLNVRIFK